MDTIQQINSHLQQAMALLSQLENGNSGSLPQFERRISKGAELMRLAIQTVDKPMFVIKDVFTTKAGSWNPSLDKFAIEPWARQSYYDRNKFLEMGGDHHVFGAVLDKSGQMITGMPIVFGWPSGMEVYKTGSSGWAHMAMFEGGAYNPDNQSGPYYTEPIDDQGETLKGIGLPYGEHVSTFCVWQEI